MQTNSIPIFKEYYRSPLGIIEIKADSESVLSVLFANSWKGPEIDEDPAPADTGNEITADCRQQLTEYFEGKRQVFEIAFRQTGTLFQDKVWNALLDIPFGTTISYLELSRRIGNTKAIRAVGTTNGKNQLCIIVPCHRVIGANGSLVGYGGELWRKKWLLEHEARYGRGVQTLGGW
ncbi:MAG: methylated-DNA--[protein]-cysteine S-methyltransferase [Chitinophagaceae bacterium]|nr:methylated-DNA--[protein]-cysteine S-methyltransferase [Chitinophagaceae bacterium]MCW5928522.1 methylated-DNA--[protein]-cysteine S-methyltransferase [Chitinophagaceae bacterium]